MSTYLSWYILIISPLEYVTLSMIHNLIISIFAQRQNMLLYCLFGV